jgi:hypothetical protein
MTRGELLMRHRWWLVFMVGMWWGSYDVWAAASTDSPNVAQVDLSPTQQVSCEGPQPIQILGLSMNLETSGNPVMVSVVLNYRGGVNAAFSMQPVVDGTFGTEDQVYRHLGTVPQIDVLTVMRMYPLAEGVHHFGVEINSCQGSPIITNGWLTVYELPPAKLK